MTINTFCMKNTIGTLLVLLGILSLLVSGTSSVAPDSTEPGFEVAPYGVEVAPIGVDAELSGVGVAPLGVEVAPAGVETKTFLIIPDKECSCTFKFAGIVTVTEQSRVAIHLQFKVEA